MLILLGYMALYVLAIAATAAVSILFSEIKKPKPEPAKKDFHIVTPSPLIPVTPSMPKKPCIKYGTLWDKKTYSDFSAKRLCNDLNKKPVTAMYKAPTPASNPTVVSKKLQEVESKRAPARKLSF